MDFCSGREFGRRFGLTLLAGCLIGFAAEQAGAQWSQWGGPNQDFKCDSKGLTDAWPQKGPKRLWKKKLGEGYSGIVVDDGRLYTMYRGDDKEVVTALDADTGKSIWRHKYEIVVPEKHVTDFGSGPRGAPLVYKGRVFSIGMSGIMHCLSKKSGEVRWKHDLMKEFDGTFLNHGYSSSPIGYKNLVIATVGGEGSSIIAFDGKSGSVVWQKHDFGNSYSTPKIIKVDGKDQLICFMANEVVGLDPKSGELEWRFEQTNRWKQNICMPVWGEDNILFITSTQAGSHGLKLTRDGDKTNVETLWSNKKVGVHHSNAIRVGDYVYTSTGDPGLIHAVNVKTGEEKWRERGFGKATMLYADGKFIILDENGDLGLIEVTPEGMNVLARATVLKSKAWTIPTLVGKRLYLRDQESIIALDMS